MADENFAPYAPLKAVMAVIERFRESGLPDPLTPASLERIGIQASNAPRTLQAIRYLGFVDEGGNRLPAFENIRRATTEEYPEQLAEVVRKAYLSVFAIVDPATASEIKIADAFRGFEPASQRQKMVSLFMGLCRAARIAGPPTREPRTVPNSQVRPKPPARKTAATSLSSAPGADRSHESDAGKPPRLILEVVHQLPADGRWTAERRAKWLAAITAAADLLVEIEGT